MARRHATVGRGGHKPSRPENRSCAHSAPELAEIRPRPTVRRRPKRARIRTAPLTERRLAVELLERRAPDRQPHAATVAASRERRRRQRPRRRTRSAAASTPARQRRLSAESRTRPGEVSIREPRRHPVGEDRPDHQTADPVLPATLLGGPDDRLGGDLRPMGGTGCGCLGSRLLHQLNCGVFTPGRCTIAMWTLLWSWSSSVLNESVKSADREPRAAVRRLKRDRATGCGGGWGSIARSSRPSAGGGWTPRRWSGRSSRWSPTGCRSSR